MAQFIEIVEDGDVRDWQYTNPENGQKFDSVFQLRIAPDDVQKIWKRKYTTKEFNRGVRNEVVDWVKYNQDALDYCIVGWEGVKREGVDLPCEREWKLRLPEMVKAEIIRLCIGKELGEIAVGEGDGQAEGTGEEGPQASDPLRPSATT